MMHKQHGKIDPIFVYATLGSTADVAGIIEHCPQEAAGNLPRADVVDRIRSLLLVHPCS
jgi:hypothetical protein